MSEYILQHTATEVERAIEKSLASLNTLHGKTILAIGDSFVKGHSLADTMTWVSKLASRNQMSKYVYATNGVSLAHASGQSASALVNTLSAITSNVAHTDFIVLLAGHNDANPDLNGGSAIPIGENTDNVKTTFKGALNITIKTLLNAYPTAKTLFLTPFNRRGIEEPYVEAMKEICGIWCIPCFDNYHSGGICFQSEGQARVYELSNSLHLNEAGQERVSLLYESLLTNHLPISYGGAVSTDDNSATQGLAIVQITKNTFDSLTSKDAGTIYLVSGYGVFVGATCIVSSDMQDGSTEDPDPEVTLYTVTNQLSNATTNNTLPNIPEGSMYTATISPQRGYHIGSIAVTMGGVNVTSAVWDSSTGIITIPQVTGNIVIVATACLPEGIRISDHATFAIGSAYINGSGNYCNDNASKAPNRLSANIENVEFCEGDMITIGDYATYKFALSTTPTSGDINWLDGGYQSADRTLTAAEAADMRVMMVARLDNANITNDDIAYVNANAKIIRE